MLLDTASDDVVDPDQTRRLLKEMREVRSAKIRSGIDALDLAAGPGGGIALTGIGAMEIGEGRGFIGGVVDGLRYVLFYIYPRLFMQTLLMFVQTDWCFKRTSSSRADGRSCCEWWI